jgi:hypothetical protein
VNYNLFRPYNNERSWASENSFQLCHGENKSSLGKEKDWVDRNRENVPEWGDNTDFFLLLSYNVSTHNSTSNHEEQILAGSEILTRRVHCTTQSFSFSLILRGEATNANFIVFGWTRQGLERKIQRTRGEHANHYTTDVVLPHLKRTH